MAVYRPKRSTYKESLEASVQVNNVSELIAAVQRQHEGFYDPERINPNTVKLSKDWMTEGHYVVTLSGQGTGYLDGDFR